MLKRKIAVILASDIAGYSRMVAMDEEATLRRFDSCRKLFEELIGRAGGRVFNTAGDAIMAEFQSAVDAVRCALAFQEKLHAENAGQPQTRQMWFRIGVTIGDVVERDGDLLGDGVNIAARLEGLSPEGGICVSRSVYEVVANKVTAKFSDRGLQRLKNMPGPVHAYVVSAANVAGETPSGQAPARLIWTGAALAVLLAAASLSYAVFWPIAKEPVALEDDAKRTPLASAPVSKTETMPSKPDANVVASPQPAAEKTPAPQAPNENAAHAAVDRSNPAGPESDLRSRRLSQCLDEKPQIALPFCRELAAENRLSTAVQAQVELTLGVALRETHDAKGAIEALTQSIAHAPISAAFNQRGVAYFELGQFDKAIADFSDSLRLDANNGEALNNRAWTYFETNRPQDGLEDANRAVTLLGNRAFVWDTRAHINEKLGDRAAATRDFRNALSIDSSIQSSKEGLERLGVKR